MGHRNPLLPVAPLHGGWRAVVSGWLPTRLLLARLAFGGLAWVRTSWVGRLCSLRSRAPVAGRVLHSSAWPLPRVP